MKGWKLVILTGVILIGWLWNTDQVKAGCSGVYNCCIRWDRFGECVDTGPEQMCPSDSCSSPCDGDDGCRGTGCRPRGTSCSGWSCSAECDGGTRERVCTDGCNTWTETGGSCNTQACCKPQPIGCGPCSVSCGGGTQWCGDGCDYGYRQACNTQSCCTVTNPGAPGLVAPANGTKLTSLTTTLSWSGVNFGTGCPSNSNQYRVYAEAGDSTPDVLVATVGSGTTSYNFAGEGSQRYYWQVVASNGSRTAASAIRSFYTPGLVTGTLFDASAVDNCATMPIEPKISGSIVNINGVLNYTPTTNTSGVYSQIVDVPGSYVVSPVVGDPYSPTPKLTCQGTSADFVVGGVGTQTFDFGFWRIYGGWFQAIGGDIYGGGGIESIVPVSLPVDSRYLIKADTTGNGGVAQYGEGSEIVLEYGQSYSVSPEVSETGWTAESGYAGQDINYEYYMAKMRILDKTDWNGVGKPVYNPVDGYEVYTHTGDVTINFGVSGGEKMVFMIDGNVTVNSNVTVALGSHLAVISSGDISFIDSVSEVHGWWVADRIIVESTGDEVTEIQFRGEGSFVGWDAVEFNRDRGITNNTAPAEEFTYRSDLMVNAPDALKFSRYVWSEQVP
jgi:hypothetical protein